MYGLIAKIVAVPGKQDELIAALIEGTAGMPGCFAYVVAQDASEDNAIWVTEVWDSMASHDASLTLPSVRNTVAACRPMIAGFEKVAVTRPAGGIGLPI